VDPFSARAVRAAYDTVAGEYVEAFAHDLERLALDRAVLDAVVEPSCPGASSSMSAAVRGRWAAT